jgi:hypothetical protein
MKPSAFSICAVLKHDLTVWVHVHANRRAEVLLRGTGPPYGARTRHDWSVLISIGLDESSSYASSNLLLNPIKVICNASVI